MTPLIFPKAYVLVETARERTSRCLNLSGQTGVVGKEIWRQTIHCGAVIDGQRLVAYLTFIIADIEKTIVDERSADRAPKLLPAIVRLGNPLLLVDLVVGAGGGVKDVVVGIAVNLVGATLSNRIHQATPAPGRTRLRIRYW